MLDHVLLACCLRRIFSVLPSHSPSLEPHHVSSSPSLSGQPFQPIQRPIFTHVSIYSLFLSSSHTPNQTRASWSYLLQPLSLPLIPLKLHMKAMRPSLFRTGSGPVQKPVLPGFPNSSLSSHASLPRDHIPRRSSSISLCSHSPDQRDTPPRTINRAMSESDAIRSATESFGVSRKMKQAGARSFPATVSGEEFLSESEWHDIGGKWNYAGVRPDIGISLEEFGFGGGVGSGSDDGIATVTGGNDGDRVKIGAYYEEMLKSNPTDGLLLGNYGKFLYEVEKDAVRAEEYYGRAILANPGDGELLSLYGKLIWETQRDEGRAKSYFEHAVHASPNDCSILGSYAHFMWEAEEEEDGANRIATEVAAACE